MDVTLEINGRVFSNRLSTYDVEQELSYSNEVTTIDGTEHFDNAKYRDIISFSLFPYDDETATKDFEALRKQPLSVVYTFPAENCDKTAKMRLSSNLNSSFGLKSVNGLRYYKGNEIVLRAISVYTGG